MRYRIIAIVLSWEGKSEKKVDIRELAKTRYEMRRNLKAQVFSVYILCVWFDINIIVFLRE